MELKSCNKFWYVILVSFILCKGLKQLIPPFLWHREACRVQAGKLPLALMSLNEDQPSSVKLKRSCLQKTPYFRKQYCVKNQWAAGGWSETRKTRNSPTEDSSLPCHHCMQKNPIQVCSHAGAGVRAGEGRQLLGEAGGIGQHIQSGLSSLFATASLCPTALIWFLHHNRINLIFFATL